MSHPSITMKKYILLAGDIVLCYISLMLTLSIRYFEDFSTTLFLRHLFPFSIIFFTLIVIFYINELYELEFVKGTLGLFGKLTISLVIGGVIAATFFYFGYNRVFTLRPQRVLLIDLVIILLLLYLWRVTYLKLTKSQRFLNNVLIVGENQFAREINRLLQNKPHLGFCVKAVKQTNEIHNLKELIARENIQVIVSTISPRENNELMRHLFETLHLGIQFFDASNFYERITGKIPVTTIQHIWFLENFNERRKRTYDTVKRLFDMVFSLCIGLISLPFLPLVATAIKLDSKGKIFFIQERVGRNGKVFRAIKFRSMKVDADKDGPQWAVKNDPRVTRIGVFLRKSRIDEIPQLINVFKGEMSLIGPRPEQVRFVQELEREIPFYRERLLIKPGLTGWAQVVGPAYGGSKEETFEKLQYDLYYVKNRSFGLDLSILLKTIKTVLSGSGH